MNDEHRDDEHDGAAPEPSEEAAAEVQPEPNLDEVEPELLATFTEIGIVETRRAIEAILLVATDPTPASLLAQLLEVPVEHVELLCHALADSYEEANHGFQLVKVAGGWRFQTHPDMAPYVERFAMDGQSTKLSNAALETLAIVAYKQPISRAQVSAIRGVNVDAVLRTLVQRGYVDEVGRDTGAGQAVLFGTTSMFLERLGINAVTDLPALGDFVPSAEVVEALEQTLKVDLDPDLGVIDPDEEPPVRQREADPAEEEVEAEVEADVGVGVGADADTETVAEAEIADTSAADADLSADGQQGGAPAESAAAPGAEPAAVDGVDRTEPEVGPAAPPEAEAAEPSDEPEPESGEVRIETAAQAESGLDPVDVDPADAAPPDDVLAESAAVEAAESVEAEQPPDFRRDIVPPESGEVEAADPGQQADLGPDAVGSEDAPGEAERSAAAVTAEPVVSESAADGAGGPESAPMQPPTAPEEVVGDAEASPKSGAAGHAGGLAPIDDRQQPTGPAHGREPNLAGPPTDPLAGARPGIGANGDRPGAFDDGAFDDGAFDDGAFDDGAFDDGALDDGADRDNTDRGGQDDAPDLGARSDPTSRSGTSAPSDGPPRPGPEPRPSDGGRLDSDPPGSAHPGGGQTGTGGGWRPSASSAGGAGQPVTSRPGPASDRPGPSGNPGTAPASAPTGAAPTPAGVAAQPDDPDPGHVSAAERHGLPAAGHDPDTGPGAEANRQPGRFLHRSAVPGDGPGSPGLVGAADPAVAPPASPVTGPEPVVHLDPVIDLTAEAVSEPDADRA